LIKKGKRGKDMKTFKKVLASTLAAAMVVTALPVTPANAAAAPKLSTTKAAVYVGQSKTIKVTTPKTWKSVKVKATTSKKSVATVKTSAKKVTVKAVKAGTAKVTVKVTAKKAGKKVSKSLKATITVKNPSLTLKAANEVAVGAKETVKATVKPASTKVTFSSSDETIATVDATTGEVTGVKAGEVTITAKAGKTTKTVKMAVKDVILKDVKQTTTTKLVATIAGNTANVKASDIVITNTYSKANIAVKSVSVDAKDKTQVTVETYVAMNDGKDYTVTLADVTKTITATDGKIAAATISPATVVVPTPANDSNGKNANDISAKFTDVNGVEIATVDANQTSLTGFTYVEWKVDATNNGYLSGKTLTLYKAGNTAKVTVIAHTGKYNASAVEEGNVTAEATITGVDATAVTTAGWNVKFGKSSDKATEFKNVKETQVAVKDTDAVAYIQRSTSDGKTADAKDYKFESSNNDVMTVESATTTVKDTTAVKVNPYKAGNAYIIVKDSKNNVVTTLPVTIGAERKAATLTLDKNAFTLSNATGVDANATVKATVKDQYGNDVTITKLSYKLASDPDTAYQDVITNSITIDKPALKDGKDTSYTYIVKYGDLKTTFVITVRKAEATASTYALELSADSVDAIIKSDAKTNTTVTAKVCGYDKNGVKVSDGVTGATFALTKDGKEAKDVADSSTSASIKVNDIESGKQMATGTYLVTAKVGDKTFTKTFEVKNTQPVATASLKETSVTTGTTLKSILKVVYDGKELKDADFSVVGDPTIDKTTNFDKITVVINVGSNKVQQEITLGKTVVLK
jgi:hypothetical protein